MFQMFETRQELKLCLHYNYWHALIWDCAIMSASDGSWQMWRNRSWSFEIQTYFTNGNLSHISEGETWLRNWEISKWTRVKVVPWFHLTSNIRIRRLIMCSNLLVCTCGKIESTLMWGSVQMHVYRQKLQMHKDTFRGTLCVCIHEHMCKKTPKNMKIMCSLITWF